MSVTFNLPITTKTPPPHRNGDIGKPASPPQGPTFGARPRRDEFMRCPSSDDLSGAAQHASRIGEATDTGASAAQRKHAKVSLFGIPGLDLHLHTVTTKTPASPHEEWTNGTKTKERYLSLDTKDLRGRPRELWRGSTKVDVLPRVGRPGRVMAALQRLAGRLGR